MIRNYISIAFRHLCKRKFYAIINVLGLAIGMSCTLLIAVYILQELSYDRFHEKADRIYRLATHLEVGESGFIGAGVSPAVAQPFKEETPAVEMVVRMNRGGSSILMKDEITIKEDKILAADPDFFRLFSFPLLKGNPEKVLQEPNSVVMTQETARKYFQQEDPLGQTIFMDGELFQITGIMEPMPQASHFHFDIIYSYITDPISKEENWGKLDAATYFLLREGAAIEEVEANLDPLLKKYLREYAMFQEMGYTIEMFTQALTDIHLHSHILGEYEANSNIKYLYIFGAIAFFILLIACINFMNLATARSADRAKEVGVRKTMGSRRTTLVQQFLAESLLLSLVAMLLALGLAELLRIPFGEIADKDIQLPLSSPWFLPSVLLLGIIVGVLAGSYPAFYLTRFRPVEVLRGRLGAGSKNAYLRNSLVVFQFVVSIVLIVCTLLVYEQLQFVRNKDLGFDKENVIILENALALGTNTDSFKNALLQMSEVQSMSFTNVSPLGGYEATGFIPASPSDSSSGSAYRDEDALVLSDIMVSYDYLPTMGIQLKEGRNFSREIASDSAYHAVILNEQAVKTLGMKEPVGNTVLIGGMYVAEVVGVVEDFHFKSLHSAVEPLVIVLSDKRNFVEVKVASDNLPHALALLEEQWNLHADGTPFDYSFLDEDFDALFRADQRVGMIFGGFTILAIFIACLGLLALASFMAEQRSKEIGIRKVMGASVKSIMLLLSKDFTKLVIIAFVVAIPLSYFAVRQWLNDFAYKIDIGLTSFIIAGVLALLIAVLTVSYQSVKAALANPVNSLRDE
ncbi:putative ABC transport system permease protein [Catalinimonas alkaloidigena]|uniref:ABC transporter permease n=1 Tax=Catalinimonas alkaloidigena TaxID=1075417 RepID=UPI00240596D4|nr:ABC transporter permease [Catalinimonas alkaloidigena]MDF9799872.1 putative ABC transport system permease protein [Catalinimonas alkaloidigena]